MTKNKIYLSDWLIIHKEHSKQQSTPTVLIELNKNGFIWLDEMWNIPQLKCFLKVNLEKFIFKWPNLNAFLFNVYLYIYINLLVISILS